MTSTGCGASCAGARRAPARPPGSSTTRSRAWRRRSGTSSGRPTACRSTASSAVAFVTACACTPTATRARRSSSMDATMVPRPGALGAGAAGGDQGRLDPRPRARPRLRGQTAPDELFTPELYARRAKRGRRRARLQRAEVRPRRPHRVHAGHRVGHAQPRRGRRDGRPRRGRDRRRRPEVDVAFDCHWRYQVADAQRLAHELEPLGLLWLEDPVPPENVAGAAARRRPSTSTPIATGENGYLRHGFREAFECGAIDIAAPDLQKTGGLLEGRRIADYADTHYISIAPHCIASPIGTIAAVARRRRGAELPRARVARHERPVLERPRRGLGRRHGDRGRAHPRARGPGLGVELNLDVAREYARVGRAVLRRVAKVKSGWVGVGAKRPSGYDVISMALWALEVTFVVYVVRPSACRAVGRIVSSGT